jgi:hypothetical protein
MALEPLLLVPDSHHPYADMKAWGLMLKVGRALKPQHIYCIGDLLDFYSVSSYSKDPARKASLGAEVAAGNEAMDALDALKAKHKTFIAGNHEDRLQRHLQDKDPQLLEFVDVAKLLRLKERGWKYVPYRSHCKLGKLNLTHDVGNAGRFSTYKALDTFQHSVVTGHAHRMSYVVEGNAVGEVKLSAQFGWLGDASKVDYMQKINVLKNWALGFGIGYFDAATGIVYMTPVPIVNYSCVVNGRLFK